MTGGGRGSGNETEFKDFAEIFELISWFISKAHSMLFWVCQLQ